MTEDMRRTVGYLEERARDPVPAYLLRRELRGERPAAKLREELGVDGSKWMRQLANEQRENGSFGRFHTQDTKDAHRRAFVTTEQALRRMADLGLCPECATLRRSLDLMKRYLAGGESWPDVREKHEGFETAFRALIAANLSRFGPEHPFARAAREAVVRSLEAACSGGAFREDVWEAENRRRGEILLRAYMVYPAWLAQSGEGLMEPLQRRYLGYLWNRREGLYYVSGVAPAALQPLESKAFSAWLHSLEALSGFSLFPEFMRAEAAPHLWREIGRLMGGGVALPPPASVIGRYAESWRQSGAREADLILRIARVLRRCEGERA